MTEETKLKPYDRSQPTGRTRRYFVAEGDQAKELAERVLQIQKAHRDKIHKLQEDYKAAAVMTNNLKPTGLVLDKDFAPVPGCRAEKYWHEGKEYKLYTPLLNRKLGKDLAKRFKDIGTFSGSDIILKHYKAVNYVLGDDHSMWVSTAGIINNVMILQVPVDSQNPFDPAPESGLREIKKSEYVALTEESNAT